MLDAHEHLMPRIVGGKIQHELPLIRGRSIGRGREVEEPVDGGRQIDGTKTRPNYILLFLRFLLISADLRKG